MEYTTLFEQTVFPGRGYQLLELEQERVPHTDALFHGHHHSQGSCMVRFLRQTLPPKHQGLSAQQLRSLVAADFDHPCLMSPVGIDMLHQVDLDQTASEENVEKATTYIFLVMILPRAYHSMYGYMYDTVFSLANVSDVQKLRIAAYLVGGVLALHRKGMAHGGLHPRNLLLFPNDSDTLDLKLADWTKLRWLGGGEREGKDRSSHHADDHVWKPEYQGYQAPELLMHSQNHDDQAADMWSVGMVLFHWCFGHQVVDPTLHTPIPEQLYTLLGFPGETFFQHHGIQAPTHLVRHGDSRTPVCIADHIADMRHQEPYKYAFNNDRVYYGMCRLISSCLQWESSARITAEAFMEKLHALGTREYPQSLKGTWSCVRRRIRHRVKDDKHPPPSRVVCPRRSWSTLRKAHFYDVARLLEGKVLEKRIVDASWVLMEWVLLHERKRKKKKGKRKEEGRCTGESKRILQTFGTAYSLLHKLLRSSRRSSPVKPVYLECAPRSPFERVTLELQLLRELRYRLPLPLLVNARVEGPSRKSAQQ